MAKADQKLRDLFAQLDAFYAQLPKVACKGQCAIACGMIPLTALEARRLQITTHKKPRATADGTCIYLTMDERCSVYAIRPLICRVWGTVKTLSCMHGCVPDRWFDEAEFIRMAQAIERIAGELLIAGPEGLVSAGTDFASFGSEWRDVRDDAERTRNLRALHGGRILAVNGSNQSPEVNFVPVERKDE